MSKTETPPVQPDNEENNDEVIGRALVASLVVLLVVALAGGGIAWWMLRKSEVVMAPPGEIKLPDRTRDVADVPPTPFTDITKAAGIDFVHENGAQGEKLLPETMGSGCAFLDYDNDGDQDLLLVNSCRWPWDNRPVSKAATSALYRNDGKGNFENVTEGSGLDVSFYAMGVAVGDYDGDGRVDLLFTAVGKNRLFRNVEGRFQDVTEDAGVAGPDDAWGTSCGWFDCDNDGDLDLFICHYVQWSKESDVAQDFQLVGRGGRAYGRPQNFGGTFCSLFRNDGEGKFSDISQVSGIQVANADTKVPAGKSLGLAFADFDDDGLLDVVVANDTVANFLFHNKGGGTFQNVAELCGVAYDTNGLARGAMGIDVAWFRNDSSLGIAIGNFSNEPTALYVSRGNKLQFRDDAVSNGLGPATRLELKFGLFFFDADLDGRLDLYTANGHLEEDIHRVQATQTYAQQPHFFWNCGPDKRIEFAQVTKEKCGAEMLRPMVGRGSACADIDGDGDLDIVATASGGPARLLRNDQKSGHHWLRLRLMGKSPNTDAIGALVELHQGDTRQRRLVSPTRSYLSQGELPVTFGLGGSDKIGKVVIRWPNGDKQELTGLKPDQLHEVHQE